MKYLLNIFILIGFISPSVAQNPWCGSNSAHEALGDHPEFHQFDQQFEMKYDELLQEDRSKKSAHYVIPVVFHVIHEGGNENVSLDAIKKLVEETNKDFANMSRDTSNVRPLFKDKAVDVEIELRLARLDPQNQCTNGVNRVYSTLTNGANNNVKNLSRWNPSRYLNIWVVKSINLGGGGGKVLGYAYYPPAGVSRPSIDGIVMRSDVFNGNTLTHEIGHYLNLAHTFDNGCSGGDRVDDTPPTSSAHYRCDYEGNSCSNDIGVDLPDQIENHMDYSSCRGMFTAGQRARMHAALETYRGDLFTNLEEAGVGEGDVAIAPSAGLEIGRYRYCKNETFSFTPDICNTGKAVEYSWTLIGPETYTYEGELPSFSIDKEGVYDLKLKVRNEYGADSIRVNEAVEIVKDIADLKPPFTQTFDNEQTFPEGYQIDSEVNGFQWQLNSNIGQGGGYSAYVNNYQKGVSGAGTSLVLPPVDFSEVDDPTLRFRIAYAMRNDQSNDVFKVEVSPNCTETWSLRYTEISPRMITAENHLLAFTPTEVEWREIEIDLNRFEGFASLLVRFTFESNGGNNFYIDNIALGEEILSLPDNELGRIQAYPNPGNGLIKLSNLSSNAAVSLFDLSGRKMSFNRNGNSIDMRNLTNGYYIFEIRNESGVKRIDYLLSK